MTTQLTLLLLSLTAAAAGDGAGNRLTYLDEFCDPYYAGRDLAVLSTPQWIGDKRTEAIIVLACDDHDHPARHEQYMRPILERLKQIDGRAGVSLMTTRVDPTDPQLQAWLHEGVTIEAHTYDHPCPCLQAGVLAKAKKTYDDCVDLLHAIPSARPVAFRMPCCDSMNSVSPRFFTEIFQRTTERGHFLALDSSVFQLFSANDPELPRALVIDQSGRQRFRKYVPSDRLMVNFIEDYPYPYVIGRLCWEIPCLMPSDWNAQHLNGKCSPATVVDLQAAVDAVVAKRGIFSLCFHRHGWIRNDQVVAMIDYAVAKYGARIQFLSFGAVHERLVTNLLAGHPLRTANGHDNGARLLDVNGDGFLDVVVGNAQLRQTRLWSPTTGGWISTAFPIALVRADGQGQQHEAGARFGVLQANGYASVLVGNESVAGLWHFDGNAWIREPDGLAGLELDGPVHTAYHGCDRGVRLRDLDGDGVTELIVGNPSQNAVFRWLAGAHRWFRLPIRLPDGTMIVDAAGRDAGLRFVDIDEDGHADVVFSDAERSSIDQFVSIDDGWSRRIVAGPRGAPGAIPMIVRADGSNNGAWFKDRSMWVQNEDTGQRKPDHVECRSFAQLLMTGQLPPNAPRPAGTRR